MRCKLVVEQVSKSFVNVKGEKLSALSDINIYVDDGEFVALIGPSGCGKTTLLDCIMGLESYENGKILIGNKRIGRGLHRASYLMQDDGLFAWRRVIDNILLPLEIKGVDKKSAKAQAQSLINQFGLSGFEDYYPDALSGGMRQRVALARTYMAGRSVVLMDEPFSRLDALTKQNIQQWFLNVWHKDKKSVLFVTHDIEEAVMMADRVYIMSKNPGKIVGEVVISLPRPRKSQVILTSQFISLRKVIVSYLR